MSRAAVPITRRPADAPCICNRSPSATAALREKDPLAATLTVAVTAFWLIVKTIAPPVVLKTVRSTLSMPPKEILFPSACAALYKRAMIDEVGFFDDDFFAYCEDTDLGLRGRIAGWGAILAPQAVVYHKYSGTGGAFSSFKLFLVERNHYWVVLKNFPLPLLLAVPFYTLARYSVQARSIFASRGSGREFLASGSRGALLGAVLKGTVYALGSGPRMFRKRRRIMRSRKISGFALARLMLRHQLTFRELLDI